MSAAVATSRSDGPDPAATLQRLIAPNSIEGFLSQVWEQTCLHVSGSQNPDLSGYVRSLMSLDDIDRLLTTVYAAGLRPWDSVRLGRDGVLVPAEEFLRNRQGPIAEVDVDKVLALHRAGASIILNAVQEAGGPVADLCSQLSHFFGVYVQANAYVTPAGGQGFPIHHDTHDVFLLQMAGEKDWRLYGSPVALALSPEGDGEVRARPEPSTRLRLRTGELLYMPRGLEHEGVAGDAISFHLTIGVHPYTWSRLLRDVIAELENEDVEFRRSVAPRLGSVGDRGELIKETLRTLSTRLLDVERAQRAANHKSSDIAGRIPDSPRGSLMQLYRQPEILLTTVVRAREPGDVEITSTGDKALLVFGGRALTLPSFTEPQLRALLRGGPIRAEELPSGLDDQARLVLVRRLVREGVLEVSAELSPPAPAATARRGEGQPPPAEEHAAARS